MFRIASQARMDKDRVTYLISFPAELDTGQLLNWLRLISGSINRASLVNIPSIVLETWATDRDIVHRLSMPWQDADYIIKQLQGCIPGMGAVPDKQRPRKEWDLAAEFRIRRTEQPIVVKDSLSMANSMLKTMEHLEKGETAIFQWVVSPIARQGKPIKPLTVTEAVLGAKPLSKEQIALLKAKQDEPNFLGSLRVGINAMSPSRRKHLLNLFYRPLASTGRFRVAFTLNERSLADAITNAASPFAYGCQISASELISFMTWPIGSPLIAGLPSGAPRDFPPTADIPSVGRVLGNSTIHGSERPIAQSHAAAATHTFVGGSNGVGKTTLMANMAKQDMEAGHGLVVLEAKGDLFYEVLDYVPRDRLEDVVIVDFTNGLYPVGFNLLDQGNPRTVIDELVSMFQFKYKDNGVWFRRLMFHGLMTLSTVKGLTFNDLSPLISPRNPEEKVWADSIIKGLKDRELIKFWHDWSRLKENERVQHAGVVENRIWQLIGRIEPRYLFGQGTSSFQMEDIIRQNKILLVNLSGVPKESAEIVGTLLFGALWEAAQRVPTEKENYVYLDEFQMFADIPMGFDDVLALARKFKLGMVLATQYIERLPQNLSQAIKANARTKIIFQTNAEGANIWQHEFGSRAVDKSDITNLKAYMAIARINTENGVSSPVTLKTLAPAKKAGTAKAATLRSNEKYGRRVADIERQETERRMAAPTSKSKRPNIATEPWVKD